MANTYSFAYVFIIVSAGSTIFFIRAPETASSYVLAYVGKWLFQKTNTLPATYPPPAE